MRKHLFQISQADRALSAVLLCACGVMSGLAAVEAYSPPPFGYYQPILDRMPFGALPPNFNAVPVDPSTLKNEAQIKADQQKLAKQINMSAVNVTPEGGTAIGFTDLSEKPPINYYLLVGASAGGWSVLAADYDEETATIEKDGVSITLKLGKGLIDAAPPEAKPAAPTAAAPLPLGLHGRATPPLSPPLERKAVLTAKPSVFSGKAPAAPPEPASNRPSVSYMERLRERKQQETLEHQLAAKQQQEHLETLARAAAQKEIKKREEEAALAAEEEAAAQEQEAPAQEQEAPAEAPIQEGNIE